MAPKAKKSKLKWPERDYQQVTGTSESGCVSVYPCPSEAGNGNNWNSQLS